MSTPNFQDAFAAMSAEEAEMHLRASADEITEGPFDRPLTPDEIARFNADIAGLVVRKKRLELDKKQAAAEFDAELKPLRKTLDMHADAVATGTVMQTGKLYHLNHQESGLRLTYALHGGAAVLIDARSLRAAERQLTIHSAKAPA